MGLEIRENNLGFVLSPQSLRFVNFLLHALDIRMKQLDSQSCPFNHLPVFTTLQIIARQHQAPLQPVSILPQHFYIFTSARYKRYSTAVPRNYFLNFLTIGHRRFESNCFHYSLVYGKMPRMDLKVITLVGMPGAGKSTLVDYLEQKGFPNVYFGGITIDEVKRRGLEVNPDNEKLVREDLRKTEGAGVYATRIITKIEALAAEGHNTVVADGLYSWTEYKIFKEKFGDNAVIIAVTAPRKLRHERLANRPVRPLTDEEVTKREYAEIENIEKGGPIANADYTLLNDGAPEELIRQLEAILSVL